MRDIIYSLFLAALVFWNLSLSARLSHTDLKIDSVEGQVSQARSYTVLTTNALQDLLEERIGIIEQDLDSLKFILGAKR